MNADEIMRGAEMKEQNMTDIEADLMIANAEIKRLQARIEATISGQGRRCKRRSPPSANRQRIKGCDFCLDPDGDNCDNGSTSTIPTDQR